MTRLLVADDDEQNLYLLQVLLRGHGYEVVTAANGSEALDKARHDPPAMIISDILMPVMDGFTLCREWKKDGQLQGIPFLFYTATYTDVKDRDFALGLGAEGFIVKPAEPDTLLETLETLLEKYGEGQLPPPRKSIEGEPVFLKKYSERLVKKLEDKMLQLQETNRSLEQQIDERTRVERQLKKYKEELQNLTRSLHLSREQERADIARDIHDDLGQKLTALKMDAFWLKKQLSGENEEFCDKLDEMSHLIDESAQVIKKISSGLRPGVLDDFGLGAAIQWQLKEFERRTQIQCDIRMDMEEIELEDMHSTGVFRIFQEALTNVARHAKAHHVTLSILQEGNRLIMQINDDGIGISEKQIADSKSIGLIGMRERAHLLGGSLFIAGSSGYGTTIAVDIPIQPGKQT